MGTEAEYLSLEEVAEMLGVTYQLIYRLARSGELPAVRLGKLYRVARGDLEKYLDRSNRRCLQRVRHILQVEEIPCAGMHCRRLRRGHLLRLLE